MPAAKTSIRVATKLRLVELLKQRPELADVQVAYCWPGSEAEAECVWLGGSEGPVSIADLRSGRLSRSDEFQLEVHFAAGAKGQTPEEADARAEMLYAGLANLLAEDPKLGQLDGLLAARQDEGEDAAFSPPQPDTEGYFVVGIAVVRCKARLI